MKPRALVLCALVLALVSSESRAEWYAGVYGGYSSTHDLTPNMGAVPGASQIGVPILGLNGTTLNNLSMGNSGIVGGRIGFFLPKDLRPEIRLDWIGLEVDVFHVNPELKAQTVTAVNTVTTCANPCVTPVTTNTASSFSIGSTTLDLTGATGNIVFRIPLELIQPYAGAGVGAFGFSASNSGLGNVVNIHAGYQAFGGVKMFLTPSLSLFVEYKRLMSTVHFGSSIAADYTSDNAIAGIAWHFR